MSSQAPSPPASPALPRSSQATVTLILGILSVLCCYILGPVAWYLGKSDLDQIKAGQLSREDEGLAKAGMILGIIGTIFLVLALIWTIFFGGLAIVGGLMEASGM